MLEYLTVDPKNLTVDPAWIAGVNSVNFGVNSEIYKNHTIDPSYSGRVNSEISCCNTFDGPDGIFCVNVLGKNGGRSGMYILK